MLSSFCACKDKMIAPAIVSVCSIDVADLSTANDSGWRQLDPGHVLELKEMFLSLALECISKIGLGVIC